MLKSLRSTLTNIASALRQYSTIDDTIKMKPSEFSSYLESTPSFDFSSPTAIFNKTAVFVSTSASRIYASTFQYCDMLTSIAMPQCTAIETSAFYQCSSLSEVNVPNCSFIGNYAFAYCTKLKNINIPNCTSIGGRAFLATNLSNLDSLSACEYIGDSAFGYCKCSVVSLPQCKSLGEQVFGVQNTTVKKVYLPKVVFLDPSNYFNEGGEFCEFYALEEVYAPMLSNLSWGTFWGCSKLSSIILNYSKISALSNGVFGYTAISSMDLPVCTGIAWSTFYNCKNLSVFMAPRLTRFSTSGYGTFYQCTNLTDVFIPNVTYTCSDAFEGCYNLQKIILTKISSIGTNTFWNCTKLSYIIMLSNACKLGYDVFGYTNTSYSIYVLPSMVEQYKASANWSNYASKIVAFNTATLPSELLSDYIYPNEFISSAITSIPASRAISNKYILDDAFNNCQNLSEVSLPINYYIGARAFANCSNLSTISIPNIEIIEPEAFINCSKLSTLALSSVSWGFMSSSAFKNCGLKTISIINYAIAGSCFADCSSLETATLQNITFNEYDGIFENCINLKSISLDLIDSSLPHKLFKNCQKLEVVNINNVENISMIGSEAFYNCKALSEINFSNLTSINSSAFNGCEALHAIALPQLSYLGWASSVFYNCISLSEVGLPELSVIYNGCDYLFGNCSALKAINAPKLESIYASCVFDNCTALESIYFPQLSSITGFSTFKNCTQLNIDIDRDLPKLTTIPNYCFEGCLNISSINTSNISYVSAYAFKDCSNLSAVTMTKCLTIRNYAFENCSNLLDIKLPNAKTFALGAFTNCSRLTSIVLPAAVYIYSDTFNNCHNLSAIYLLASSLIALYRYSSYYSSYFANTPIRDSSYLGYYGSIYVRNKHVESLLSLFNSREDLDLMDRLVGLTDEEADAIIDAQNYEE